MGTDGWLGEAGEVSKAGDTWAGWPAYLGLIGFIFNVSI